MFEHIVTYTSLYINFTKFLPTPDQHSLRQNNGANPLELFKVEQSKELKNFWDSNIYLCKLLLMMELLLN